MRWSEQCSLIPLRSLRADYCLYGLSIDGFVLKATRRGRVRWNILLHRSYRAIQHTLSRGNIRTQTCHISIINSYPNQMHYLPLWNGVTMHVDANQMDWFSSLMQLGLASEIFDLLKSLVFHVLMIQYSVDMNMPENFATFQRPEI